MTRDVDEAAREFDFEDFLQSNGVEMDSNGRELRGDCPFCLSTRRRPFCVSATTGAWICQHCGKTGGPVGLIAEILRVPYKAARDRLFDNFVVFVDEEEEHEEAKVENVIDLPKEFSSLAGDDSIVSRPYRRYAKRRHIDSALATKYNIGYCATGKYASRLIVPVTHLFKVVSFVARDITDTADIKVDTPYGNEQSRYCFNLDHLWGATEVVITEGVFDALVLPDIAVATFGKRLTDAQVILLRSSGVRTLTFCYDEDAISAAEEFASMYSSRFDIKLLELPAEADPSELGREAMLELLPTAQAFHPYLAR